MHILLTGSSGWLGRFLAPRLRVLGHAVTGLDVAAGADTDIIGSVADRETVKLAFDRGIEAVIHAGALHKPDIVRYPAQRFVDVNVSGTLNLLEAATAAGHDRFVFTSTTSLMINRAVRDEATDAAVWLDETSGPLAPRNIYGVTKLAAEGLCRLHAVQNGLSCVVLRTGRFFPEEDDTHRTLSGENLKANEFLHRLSDGRGCGGRSYRGAGAGAAAGLRNLCALRADSFQPNGHGGAEDKCPGCDRPLLPRGGGALRGARLDASGDDRPGL